MKKVLGGCLIVAVLALVVGGGAAWWFVMRPAWQTGSQMFNVVTQVTELAKLDEQVKNRGKFTPPQNNEIPPASLDSFLHVQQAIRGKLGTQLYTLQDKYNQIAKGDSKDVPDLSVLMAASGDLFGLLLDAKQAQVDALNAQQLSLEEYRWIRNQVYSSLSSEAFAASARNSDNGSQDPAIQRLVEHQELLLETAIVAWLGL